LLAHGGEFKLTESDFEQLLQKAPTIPMTHWRSVKKKFAKSLGFA